MEPGHLSLLLLLPPLLALSAFFSASETALFSLTHGDRVRLSHLSRAASASVSSLLEHPRALLITILVANNLVNVSYIVVSSVLASHSSAGAAVAISAGSLLALILLGEIFPKLFSRKKRVEFARVLAGPMLMLHRLITPLRAVLDRGVIAPLSRLARPAAPGEARTISQEELSALLEISAQRGEIDAQEQQLLAEVVELNSIRVRDAMTPRQDMPWLEHSAGPAELLAVIQRCGRMLIPVMRGSLDGQVLGMVDARRFLAMREQAGRQPRAPQILDFLHPALFVPSMARLDQCLEQFRRQRAHEALCVDEYGGVVGLIRIEDVVRELLVRPGAGAEENAPVGGGAAVQEVGPGQWEVPGRLGLRALMEFLAAPDVETMYQRVSTVAGAIIVNLGRVPTVGDVATIGNVRLEVAVMRGRSVERVMVSLDGRDHEGRSTKPAGAERVS